MNYDGSIIINTQIDREGAKKSIDQMSNDISSMIKNVENKIKNINLSQFSNAFKKGFEVVAMSAMNTANKIKNIFESSFNNQFVNRVSGIFAGLSLAAFGKSALESTAQIQLASVKLKTLMGSFEQAQTMLSDIIKMADVTPYGGEDLIQAVTTLKGFGVANTQLIPTITMLGNAAAGSAENLKAAAYALGQIKSQGRATTMDIRQFINAGIPMFDLLSKSMKRSTTDIMAMVEQGKIGYNEVNGALKEFYSGNGMYAGLMAEAAATLPGMFSTMMDTIMSAGREVVGILEPVFKSLMANIINVFTVLTNWLRGLSPNAKKSIEAIAEFVIVFTAVAGAIILAKNAFELFNAVLLKNPLGLVIGLVGGLIIAINKLSSAARSSADLDIMGNVKMGERVDQLTNQYDELSKKAYNAASAFDKLTGLATKPVFEKQKEFTQNLLKSYDANVKGLNEMFNAGKFGAEEFKNKLSEASAEYAVLARYANQKDLSKAEKKQVDELKNNYDSLIKKYKDIAGKIQDQPELKMASTQVSAEEKKATEDLARYRQELSAWELEEKKGMLYRELYELEKKYEAEQIIIGDSAELRLRAEARYNTMREKITDKYLIKTKAAAYLVGLGFDKTLAGAMGDNLTIVEKATEKAVSTIFAVITNMWDLFSSGIDLLSWASAFDPQAIYNNFKSFLDGLQNFIFKNLGAIPIWFSLGAELLKNFLNGISANINTIASSFGNVIKYIAKFIIDNAPVLIKQMVNIISDIAIVIIDNAPIIFKAFLSIIVNILGALSNRAEEIAYSITNAISKILESILQNLPAILTSLVKIFIGAIQGILKALPSLIALLPIVIPSIVDAIAQSIPILIIGLINSLPLIIIALVQALPYLFEESMRLLSGQYAAVIISELAKASPQIVKALFKALVDSIIEAPKAFYKASIDAAKNIILGFVNGFKTYGGMLWNTLKNIFTDLTNNIKDFFQISSPSKLFYNYGLDIIQGLLNGLLQLPMLILSAHQYFYQVGTGLITNLVNGFKAFSILQNIKSAFSEVLDYLNDMLSIFFDIGKRLSESFLNGFKVFSSDLKSFFQNSVIDIISNFINMISQGLRNVITQAIPNIVDIVWERVKGMIPSVGGGGGLFDKVGGAIGGFFADGTDNFSGGLAVVGERGPEIVNLPKGSQVIPNKGTRSILDALSSGLRPQINYTSAQNMNATQTIILQSKINGNVVIDGRVLTQIVMENIDKYVGNNYAY